MITLTYLQPIQGPRSTFESGRRGGGGRVGRFWYGSRKCEGRGLGENQPRSQGFSPPRVGRAGESILLSAVKSPGNEVGRKRHSRKNVANLISILLNLKCQPLPLVKVGFKKKMIATLSVRLVGKRVDSVCEAQLLP